MRASASGANMSRVSSPVLVCACGVGWRRGGHCWSQGMHWSSSTTVCICIEGVDAGKTHLRRHFLAVSVSKHGDDKVCAGHDSPRCTVACNEHHARNCKGSCGGGHVAYVGGMLDPKPALFPRPAGFGWRRWWQLRPACLKAHRRQPCVSHHGMAPSSVGLWLSARSRLSV